MKFNVMKKWVAALRSGKYRQGQEQLYNKKNNTYCCLGVACKIGVAISRRNEVCTKTFMTNKNQNKLIDFNDTKDKSFKWIASYIERNWRNL